MDQIEKSPQNATPSYFSMEPHKREEILSHVGSFTQTQYQIFHNICDFWNPALEFNTYIMKTHKPALVNKNQLELLMNKLQDAHMGLLQYKLIENELRPFRIVLTEKESPLFYYYVCEEILFRHYYEHGHPFITTKSFEKYNLTLQGKYISPLEPKVLGPSFHRAMQPQRLIFGISRHNKPPILIPSGTLDEYLNFLIQYLIRESQSMTLLENISRLSSIKISEIQKSMGKREPSFWLTFTKHLFENREDLKIRIKGISPLIFTSARMLYGYFYNSLAEQKQAHQDQQERTSALMEIIQNLREKNIQWTSLKELETILNEKEKKWPGFREAFTETALKKKEGGEIPPLVILGGQLIHKDYLFPFFKGKIEHYTSELHNLYQDMMSDLLRTGNSDKYTQFYSKNNFRADILNRISSHSSQMKELLQKPSLMANITFYYLKELKGIKNNETIRQSMNLYFRSSLKQYQNIDEMLQLKLISLFDTSFQQLSWWNRLILRLSGRYDSYTGTFSESRQPDSKKKSRKGPGIQSETAPPINSWANSKPSSGNQKTFRRPHSIRDKKKAWAEFSDAVNKKK